jgi:hypothetical protein
MVGVAGLAVLGMTATLAGAQTHPAAFTLNDVMQAVLKTASRFAGAEELRNAALRPAFGVTSSTSRSN